MLVQTQNDKLAIHGHRGSRGTHPENTLVAFQEAVSSGAQVLELDLQLTKDDVPVISHEPEITSALCRYRDGRAIEGHIPIRSLTAKELEQFDCGSVPQPRFPEQTLVPGQYFLTLDSLLAWWKKKAPALELNIETKMVPIGPQWELDPHRFTVKVVEVLTKHAAIDKTILQSFDFRTLEVAKRLVPSLRLSCLFETERDFCARTKTVGATIASPNLSLVTPEEVAKCHSQGIAVVPWTANSPDEWKNLLAARVDGIITDYPRKLAAYLGRSPGT